MTDHPFLPRFRAWRRSRQQEADARARRLPLRGRLDAVMLGFLLALVAGLGAAAYSGTEAARRLGWLDPAVVEPVPDERILDNLRGDLPGRPLLAGAWHADDGVLTISQAGGAVHRYHPATGLWSREWPAAEATGLASDLVQLRGGCGGDPAARQGCADAAPLWGLGERGALVRRLDGRWRAVLGDSAFVGRDGKPVDGDALTTAALSADGEWLFLGTKAQGGGLYSVSERRWTPLDKAQDVLPDGSLERAVSWRGEFAVGGPGGLAFLDPRGNTPSARRLAAIDGAIADLLVDDSGRLLVLEKRACAEGGDGCLRVSALDRPGGSVSLLMDERNRYAELDSAALFFADLQGRTLVVAGRTGVYAYDPALRRWTRLDDRPVLSVTRVRDRVVYGYSGGAARVVQAAVQRRWELPGKQVAQIVTLGPDLAALTADGDVYALPDAGDPTAAFVRGGTAADPKGFTRAFGVGDQVLLTGPRKALLHDVRRRTYADIDPAALPSWLTDGRTPTVVAGTLLYGLVPQGGAVAGEALDLSTLAATGTAAAGTTPAVAGPIRRARAWPGNAVAVIDGGGSLQRLQIDTRQPMTGAADPALDRAQLRDVLSDGNRTVVATGSGVRSYDHAMRQWSEWAATDLDGGDIRGLAGDGGRLLLHTGAARLARPDGHVLIGKDRPTLDTAGLSDAWRVNDLLYLAGRGVVERYDLAARSVTQRWRTPGGGAVSLVDLLDGQPLVLSDGRAVLGGTVLGAGAGRVLSVSVDPARIWTVREEGGSRHIRTHSRAAPADAAQDRCLFRTAAAGGRARRLLDARALGDGWLLVLTDDGLRLYSETARSWYPVAPMRVTPERIHRAGAHVVLVAGGNPARVQSIPVASITRPDSCATAPVSLPENWTEARSVSVDEAAGTAAWLATDGSVHAWQDGTARMLLATPAPAPQTVSFLRVFQVHERLAFALPDGLAVYDTRDHAWSRVALRAADKPARDIVDLTLEPDGDRYAVTVRTADGKVYVGPWATGAATVRLDEVRSPGLPAFAQSGAAILDATSENGLWSFLLEDRLKRFDPIRRRFAPDIVFPAVDRSRALVRRGNRLVVEEGNGTAWWVAKAALPLDGDAVPASAAFVRVEPAPGEPTLLAEDGRVVRLRRNGAVDACEVDGACREVSPPSMALAPDTVTAAYRNGDLVLFDTVAGRRLYDRAERRERPTPPEVKGLGPLAEIRREDALLWLRDRAGDALALGSDGAVRARAAAVDALVTDRHDRLWLMGQGPARVSNRGELTTVEAAFALPKGVRAEVVSVPPGGVPALLGSDRRPRALPSGAVSAGVPLAPAIDVGAVSAVFPTDRSETWWVQDGRTLIRLVLSACPAAQIAPPLSAPAPEQPAARTQARNSAASKAGAGAPKPDAGGRGPTAEVAPPAAEPCLVAGLTLPLPADAGAVVAVDDDLPARLRVRFADGGTLESRVRDDQLDAPFRSKGAVPSAGTATDVWPELRRLVAPRPDGEIAIDPALGFVTDASRMRVRTASGSVALRVPVRPQPESVPALDARWLRWDRNAKSFLVAGTSGPVAVAPDQLVRDGQFIFGTPGLAVADAGGLVRVANRAGVWSFSSAALALDDAGITFHPQTLPVPVAAAHGRFLFDAGGVPYAGGPVASDDDRHTVRVGEATWTERLRRPKVAVAMRVAGQDHEAGGAGFGWDRRRAVVAAAGAVEVQTELGILGSDRLADADPGWSGRLPVSGTVAGRDGDVFLDDGGAWHRRSGGRWRPSTADDAGARDVPTSQRWRWRSTPQGLVVDQVALAEGASSVAFLDDQLHAAAVDGGRLIVADAAGLAIGTVDAIIQGGARRRPLDIDVDVMQPLRPAPGRQDVFARGRGGAYRWNAAGDRYEPVPDSANAFVNRELVAHPRLRLSLRGGRAGAELRLDDSSGGGDAWVPITMENGFPFDRVTGVQVSGGRLFVGTEAGLEEHAATGDTGFDSIARLVDLRANRTAPPAPVLRMGEPVGQPGVVAVRAPGRCVVYDGHGYAECRSLDLADAVRRAATPWWEWRRDAAGVLSGEYRDGAGAGLGVAVTLRGGRFPHDRVADVAACEGRSAVLWDGGPVTVFDGLGVELTRSMRQTVMPAARDARLFCLERPVRELGLEVSAGLYWIGERAVLHYDGAAWRPVGDAPRTAVALRADQGLPLDRERLRLVQDRRGLQFQQRRNDGAWEDLGWTEGRLGLDAIDRLTVANGRVWAATAAGVATLQRAPDGSLQVDPDGLVIVREPAPGCRVTDWETGDDGMTSLRCNADSRSVHVGRLDPSVDRGVFRPAAGDPFVERELLPTGSDGVWGWRLVGRASGRPGQLAGTFRGEPVKLVGGRFDFDSVAQLRAFTPGTLEVLTEGAGWFRAVGGLDARGMARPPNDRVDIRAVRRLSVARDDDGARRLCVEFARGRATQLDSELQAKDQVASCRDDAGTDGLWRYEQGVAGVRMHTVDRRQRSGDRTLTAGRFTDEVAIGLPVSRRAADGGVELLVPTAAGVVVFDAEARRRSLYLPAFPELPRGAAPSVLHAAPSGRVSYLGRSGLVDLDDESPRSLPLPRLLPEGSKPLALDTGPDGTLRLGWQRGGEAGWTLFDPKTVDGALRSTEPVDTSGWREYAELRTSAGNAEAGLLIEMEGRVVRMSSGFGKTAPTPLPNVGDARAVVRGDRRMFVVGTGDVWQIDLPSALRATAAASR
ncbi:hypothetical protein [Azospirillum canadense]|uniref:hypothetical protein n=1 Tax=Azospirillum canadense TaxID=403962 RepID=UPI00222750DB|nr:hypothetical protein [Azospirillum canadense]MCW2243160.1 hypothetical protein [Azospirillum canadense]